MILNRRAIVTVFFALLAIAYGISWFAPGIGLAYDDGAWLVSASTIAAGHGYVVGNLPDPVPETNPPLFAALLALFVVISHHPVWLKVLPLACTGGWLVLTRRLLLKMGASENDSLWLTGLTAACPMVLFLGTNLMAEPLFALLTTATLLMLLEEHGLAAGLLAGLATLTETAGAALVIACLITLAVRRRFRAAVIFTATSMLIIAPWFGWLLANAARQRANHSYVAGDIFTGLAASEKVLVLGHNAYLLMSSPATLLTGGWSGTPAAITIAILLFVCLVIRRQLVPDLFLLIYCLILICRTWPPERLIAPVLPLALWMVWRVFRGIRPREALIGLVVIVTALPLIATGRILPGTVNNGYFPVTGTAPDEWSSLTNLFSFVGSRLPQESILLANLNPLFYLETGRKTIRGYSPGGFDLFYSPERVAVTPDELSQSIAQNHVTHVLLTPDAGLPESESFHKSVAALERGGLLVPLSVPGDSREYRILQVAQNGL